MKLLKFDTIHPDNFLRVKKKIWSSELLAWNKEEYYNQLIGLRSNFSDFYTFHLNNQGWVAEEFFANDATYIQKVAEEIYQGSVSFQHLKNRLLRRLNVNVHPWNLKVAADYIKSYEPDVIFCREHTGIPSSFWRQFRNHSLCVARLSAPLPPNWSPLDFDVIYTDVSSYKSFFEYNGIKVRSNNNGFDPRVLDEVVHRDKHHDVSFIGGLGQNVFQIRTELFRFIATQADVKFSWWGYKTGELDEALDRTWKGITSGLDMFQIYGDSKIVVNDYIDLAGNAAVNQRMYEVMGMGTFMLTRYSDSLWEKFPKGSIATYKTNDECVDKIRYYLMHEKEREDMAAAMQKLILEQYQYMEMVKQLSDELAFDYRNKFSK